MARVSYEIVSEGLARICSKQLNPNETVSERLERAEEFMEACGWTEEAMEMYILYGELN
jgi:hypothetical protein